METFRKHNLVLVSAKGKISKSTFGLQSFLVTAAYHCTTLSHTSTTTSIGHRATADITAESSKRLGEVMTKKKMRE